MKKQTFGETPEGTPGRTPKKKTLRRITRATSENFLYWIYEKNTQYLSKFLDIITSFFKNSWKNLKTKEVILSSTEQSENPKGPVVFLDDFIEAVRPTVVQTKWLIF